jgi:asparagine synthase (glutamine-hydrolysing)
MCGIWLSIGPPNATQTDAALAALKARGPEETRSVDLSGAGTLGFTRLAINGLSPAGMQPMRRNQVSWICNGEIYNWRLLAAEYGIQCESGSDCEIIGPLYERFRELGLGPDALFRSFDGVFAIAIVDAARDEIIVARDPYGVRPLYTTGTLFASEIKAFPSDSVVSAFPPGTFQRFCSGVLRETTAYHSIPVAKQPLFNDETTGFACMAIRSSLEAAVKKRMMTERPVAALLSGGIDSSLIAALVAKQLRLAGAPPLRTFSIGMEGSSDLAHAKKVADWIGSDHTEVVLSPDQFFAAIPDVISAIESYDTTTVRASVGNWLVGKAIAEQAPDCKVVFNGDGADEVWGSYLYFYGAPSDAAYEEEVTRLLKDIHYFDVLRSDRCISSHGLEPRTPFLDKEFVATARSVATRFRRPSKDRCEKWLMRKAFDDGITLPHDVLYRRKEAFSDGVSGANVKAWYEIAQEKAAAMCIRDVSGATTTAQQHEQTYYRTLYETQFSWTVAPNVPYFWMPKWCDATDPSARTLAIYGTTG